MDEGQDVDYDVDVLALSRLATEVLARPSTRRSFATDPLGTLERAGIDAQAIPERVPDTLADMSYEELGIVGSVAQSLKDSGISPGRSGLIF
jgi:hypothetical protein